MNGRKRLVVVAIFVTTIAAPLLATAAEAKYRTYHHRYGHRTYYRPGVVVTDRGWRKRDTLRGWDPSCLDLPYLPSRFVCDAR